jgi:hypothetical protein
MNCNPATTKLVEPSNLLFNHREYSSAQLAQLASQISATQFEEITSKFNVAKFLNTFASNLNRPILSNNNFNKLPNSNTNNVFHGNLNNFNFMQTLLAANNILKVQNAPSFPAPPLANPPATVNATNNSNRAMFNFNSNLPGGLNLTANAILEQIKHLSKSKGTLVCTYFRLLLSCLENKKIHSTQHSLALDDSKVASPFSFSFSTISLSIEIKALECF